MLSIDNELRRLVTQMFGRNIASAGECKQLQTELQRTTGDIVSTQTLRRYFKLIKSETATSAFTYNALCRYIGFKDKAHFAAYLQNKNRTAKGFDFSFMETLFGQKHTHLYHPEFWYETMGNSIAELILTNQNIFEEYTIRFHNNAAAMRYVMEKFQPYDILATEWYMRGLALFCRSSQVHHHKMYLPSMQFERCVITGQMQDAQTYVDAMVGLLPKMRKEHGIVWPLEGVIHAAQLIMAHRNNDKNLVEKLIAEGIAFVHKNSSFTFSTPNSNNYQSFLTTLCELLNWHGLYECGYAFMMHYELMPVRDFLWYATQAELMKVTKAIILFQSCKKEDAKTIFDNIHIENNCRFDRKNLILIQYLLLQLGFTSKRAVKQRAKIKQQILHLTAQTGMVVFNHRIAQFE